MPPAESGTSQADSSSVGAAVCVVCGAALTGARCEACGAAARPGGYVVQRLIARTQHSRVYLARSPEGQEVALKELLFAQVPGSQELEAFEREARLLETLSHPRIPRLLGHFQEGQGVGLRLYLAAEHISGETLLERLAKHSTTEEEARDTGLQVLEILEYLHGRKPRVLHRDIKPANLIRQHDGSIFLVDFGSARESARGATAGSTLVGTFGYMPLEQLGGTVDVTSDLYALGASLVHLLGGTPPADHFRPERGLDLSHLEAPALLPWLRKLTALRPGDRYSSATLARQALQPLQPRGTPSQSEPMPVGALASDAPSSIARLVEEARESGDATARARERQEQKALETARKETLEQEQRKARHQDDRLSAGDFFRMASFRFVPPAVLPWVGLIITVAIYFGLPAFEIMPLPALDTLAGIGLPLGMLLATYAILIGPVMLRALWWRSMFRRLPFVVEGLGQLVHRGDRDWFQCVRCSFHLHLNAAAAGSLSADTVREAQRSALKLACSRANELLSRLADDDTELLQKLRWSVQGDKAEGYANWRVARELLAFCAERLAPLHRELGIIHTVHFEPSDETLSLPSGGDD